MSRYQVEHKNDNYKIVMICMAVYRVHITEMYIFNHRRFKTGLHINVCLN